MRAASAAVALAGLAISAYLTIVHYAGGEPVCGGPRQTGAFAEFGQAAG